MLRVAQQQWQLFASAAIEIVTTSCIFHPFFCASFWLHCCLPACRLVHFDFAVSWRGSLLHSAEAWINLAALTSYKLVSWRGLTALLHQALMSAAAAAAVQLPAGRLAGWVWGLSCHAPGCLLVTTHPSPRPISSTVGQQARRYRRPGCGKKFLRGLSDSRWRRPVFTTAWSRGLLLVGIA